MHILRALHTEINNSEANGLFSIATNAPPKSTSQPCGTVSSALLSRCSSRKASPQPDFTHRRHIPDARLFHAVIAGFCCHCLHGHVCSLRRPGRPPRPPDQSGPCRRIAHRHHRRPPRIAFLPAAAIYHLGAWGPAMVLFASSYLIFIASPSTPTA